MQYPDKFQLTPDQNRRFARRNFAELVHTNARFEGVNTTLPQTRTIMDGMGVTGVSVADMNVIVQLKRGWQYITETDDVLDLTIEQQINAIVAKFDALAPGEFRTGQGGVTIGSQEDFTPPAVVVAAEKQWLTALLAAAQSTTDKALTLLYHNMRGQLFWDGNKRTATLAANKLMIDGGAGLINVPLDHWEHWNELIADYYRSGDMTAIKDWTYAHGIQGVQL